MSKVNRDKPYQFLKLCIALTKQGFKFTRQKGVRYALTFDKLSAKRLFHPDTKAPFVNSFIRISGDKTKECYQFKQWADVIGQSEEYCKCSKPTLGDNVWSCGCGKPFKEKDK